ncbi:MAG: ABC transporter permease [Sulfitobacter litoralis]|jgi:osmoprotectant transport system permease protein|uniref:ABC transporter permease n=2 Tax=root TaxID=1 RepID=A0A7V1FLJ2_9RHOB|nr:MULTISPECIES: ABC transporter permease [Sulfitobacter]MBQ0765044.1 ABC transporter permease [Sulfitobacter litoralis]MBQ0800773.1 ABC transporter permease [Sulfitobacter litoralis]MCF7726084.1 ABC transporter permease subunit [Sulfitobacter sp. M22]MCF7777461.1 ABC transporter permease subunit [Sulfitobacter sp. M220]HDY96512.1 ABC transporter permease [Sulfitobacter litoralis]|tara:strand:- start:721 stop:1455 length:735 start_codon:yes stop_codon:yes gene_type:complete
MTAGNLLRLGLLGLLLALVLQPNWFTPLFAPLAPAGGPVIYARSSLLSLSLSHLGLVALASVAATLVAVTLAIFVTRPVGASFLPLSRTITNIGQTFPPVAVLALAVPALGFGSGPTLVALFLYGLLPIFENAITALSTLPPATMEAARGMGLNRWQRLWRVELPLALPVILTGIRLSVVIALGTATIGSTVAARTLGEVIIAGLLTNNTAYVLQGGLIVGLFAVLIYDAMAQLERYLAARMGG